MRGSEPRPVAVVVGALAPYTHVLYDALAGRLDRPLHVLACSGGESTRHWTFETGGRYRFEVMGGLRWHRSTVENHYLNPAVAWRLAALRPAAVVLNDFTLTMLLGAGAARLLGLPYGVRTDGVPSIDPARGSRAHRLVRTAIMSGAAFGLGPSRGSEDLLRRYGLDGPFGPTPLFPAWTPAAPPPVEGRPYDVLFCGTLNEHMKGARFFTDVVLACLRRGRSLRVRVAGDGPLRAEMASRFVAAGIEARFDGFLQQDALPAAYASARLFHFPSRGDVWGIVVQEALQSGTVVVASPHSGAATDLLAPHGCGALVRLDVEAWASETIALLDDPARQDRLREAGHAALGAFTAERAGAAYAAMLAPFLDRGARTTAVPLQGPNSTSSV